MYLTPFQLVILKGQATREVADLLEIKDLSNIGRIRTFLVVTPSFVIFCEIRDLAGGRIHLQAKSAIVL